MRHARAFGIAALATFALAAVAYAQTAEPAAEPAVEPAAAPAADATSGTTVTPLPDAAPVVQAPLDTTAITDLAKTHWGDAKAGATKAGACAACHGMDGNPPTDMYPRLAGMPERYIAQQLALFKGEQRNTGMAMVMIPMAKPLSAQDMRDIGAFYAQQAAGAGIADDTLVTEEGPYQGMKFYQIGEKLYRGGDAQRGIPACMACHGPTGAGNPGPAYPHVAGQFEAYAARRLQEYRDGVPTLQDQPLFQVMATVAKDLTDQEINALATYLQGLHPRSDEAQASTPARVAAP
ncbi:MAG: c-type cytochrome [Lysobacteraceae bacterium]|nr:MAG: c-type cytochrome [Xanthomonadaceae bacterium]